MRGPFEDLMAETLELGEFRSDRTGTGTISLWSPDPLRYDLTGDRVPLITSKTVPWSMALREFMWMLSGSTSIHDLAKSSPAMANIWSLWADSDGNIGPTYGAQYRDAGGTLQTGELAYVGRSEFDTLTGMPAPMRKRDYGVDQLHKIIIQLANTPDTRRAVISLWSVPELEDMALEPCMVLFQFSLRGPAYDQLVLHVYQRSADLMLGVPFDLFQAGTFAHMVARELTLMTGRSIRAVELTWSAGDAHIYRNQVTPAKLQLAQAEDAEPMHARISIDPFPSLRLLNGGLEPGHIKVHDYNPMPAISAPIAV